MEIRIITQPFDEDGEPQTLGQILEETLSAGDNTYSEIWIVSAWINHRTFRRLFPTLEYMRDRGTNIHIYFGIDFGGTYVEAIRSVHRLGIDSKIIFNPTSRNTFHPKIYLFEGNNTSHLFLGSNNLTDGGLFTNYEATTWIRFDFPEDESSYERIKNQLNNFINPRGRTVADLTDELLGILTTRDLVTSRRRSRINAERVMDEAEEGEVIAEIVLRQGEDLEPLPFEVEEIPYAPAIGEGQRIQDPTPIIVPADDPGHLVWRKSNLPQSDVQRQPGNPTGGIRLTQARFEVNGQSIDQTTYFRNTVFSNATWGENQYQPYARETARIPFEINILGQDYGIQELTISHKPSGEAGQGNYTTILHWGHLGATIRELNLVGRTFDLFQLSPDAEAILRIVIN